MKIETIDGMTATVSAAGSTIAANVMLLDDTKVGEYVLVHAGFAIKKIDEREAAETIKALNKLVDPVSLSPGEKGRGEGDDAVTLPSPDKNRVGLSTPFEGGED